MNPEKSAARLMSFELAKLWLAEPREGGFTTVSEKWKSALQDKGILPEILEHWQSLCRDGVWLAEGSSQNAIFNSDQMELLFSMKSLGSAALSELFQALQNVVKGLKAQRDPILMLEDFWFQTRTLKPVQN